MQKYLIKNILVVNEGEISCNDILISNKFIEKIDNTINFKGNIIEIDGEGKHLLPGVIDDQVHFREPGLTHKATIASESAAAVAGGVTTFMEMPNTIPNALTLDLLENKYAIAAQSSIANYSFFMGVSNDNSNEALKINSFKNTICGLKIFMGSSTGNMLVNNHTTLDKIFSESELLIATHCEDERIIKQQYEIIKANKNVLNAADHPLIRNAEACYQSSVTAIQFAKKYNSRLHILHISTEKELQLFGNMLPLKEKRITAEVCVHHLHFTANDYEKLGYKIKCNPAIKDGFNKTALWQALLDDRLDVIATDHAPHLLSEKNEPYEIAHAGLPLVQHSLPLMLHYHNQGIITLQKIAEKMSHAVADCFQIKNRGYIKEGFFADLALVNLHKAYTVTKDNILYKCGWSPLENFNMPASIEKTFVNGNLVFENNKLNNTNLGMRLEFER
ncbi:MAG: dihydroorotase [Ferruginibacter sp.]|nr:dihydroorotase [Ferruginibacter sp.]